MLHSRSVLWRNVIQRRCLLSNAKIDKRECRKMFFRIMFRVGRQPESPVYPIWIRGVNPAPTLWAVVCESYRKVKRVALSGISTFRIMPRLVEKWKKKPDFFLFSENVDLRDIPGFPLEASYTQAGLNFPSFSTVAAQRGRGLTEGEAYCPYRLRLPFFSSEKTPPSLPKPGPIWYDIDSLPLVFRPFCVSWSVSLCLNHFKKD